MKFTFTDESYESKDLEWGGSLAITAENAVEVDALMNHFKLFKDLDRVESLEARLEALKSGKLTHVVKSDKRPVFEVDEALDHEFTIPYEEWARKTFGYDGQFPDLELQPRWHGLAFGRYYERLYTQYGHICFQGYVESGPHNGKTAYEHGRNWIVDSVREDFGNRYLEPEFIEGKRGQMKRNPDYLKRHAAKPAATSKILKSAFFDWWRANEASKAQLDIIAGNEAIAQDATYMSAFHFEPNRFESRIYYERTAQDYKSVSFDDFAALACADDGKGGDITRGGAPLKTYEEWLKS